MQEFTTKIMTPTEFLNNARDLNRLIDSTREMLDKLTPPKSQLSGVAVPASSVIENHEGDRQVRRFELEQKLEKFMDSLFDYKEAIIRLLECPDVSPRDKIIIEQRYVIGKSWKELADYMDYSIDGIRTADKAMRKGLYDKAHYWSFIRR